jgi:hypothetical protein
MKDRQLEANAIRNAADMLTCAAVLVELGQDADAARWLAGIHEALGLALAAGDLAALDTVLLPQFGTTPDGRGRAAALAHLETLKDRRAALGRHAAPQKRVQG